MREIMRLVEGDADAKAVVAWGETVGIYASIAETSDHIILHNIERDRTSGQKGAGATFIRKLCAYADAHHKPIYAGVTGGNEALEDYYRQFDFEVMEDTRDDETSDVDIERQPQG